MEKMGNACTILVEKSEGNNHSGDVGVDMRIILKWLLMKLCERWSMSSFVRIGANGGLL
jgi:hypothetical protein